MSFSYSRRKKFLKVQLFTALKVVFLRDSIQISNSSVLVPEADRGEEYVKKYTTQDDRDKQSAMKQWLNRNAFNSILPRKHRASSKSRYLDQPDARPTTTAVPSRGMYCIFA